MTIIVIVDTVTILVGGLFDLISTSEAVLGKFCMAVGGSVSPQRYPGMARPRGRWRWKGIFSR